MSKIEVDAIDKQSGSTVTIGGSGTNVVLGTCGQTVSLGTGATQSGFGRTGTVDWQTGSIKTSTFTAANGEGYFANTSGGAFVMNLPAGTAGNIVSVVDYTNTFQTNALTIAANGTQKIGGVQATVDLSTEGQSVTFVYVDDTEGWKNTMDSTSNVIGAVPFITATVSGTGNTLTTAPDCANVKIATFTGPGTFCVSAISSVCAARNTVGYMVVAGGGGAGSNRGGGAGAGGYREGRNAPIDNFTASPLVANAPTNAVTVTASAFPITVGGGGAGANCGPSSGVNGSNSIFSTITSAGGGFGGSKDISPINGNPGGSGGGSMGADGSTGSTGTGNTPPTTPSQGNPGNTGSTSFNGAGGGGGGATVAGSPGPPGGPGLVAGGGGAGATSSITGSPVGRAGGGGGSPWNSCSGGTASDGGGAGVRTTPAATSNPGTVNTGGGGGAGLNTGGGNGGSGIVVIRYKFQ